MTKSWAIEWCGVCSGVGWRGADACNVCERLGQLLVHLPTGKRFPNTQDGWKQLMAQRSPRKKP